AEGYEVETVADGESALDKLLQPSAPIDVVVLDVMLPGKSGFQVAHELRAARQYVPVLMLTARGRPEDVLRGFEAGADDYLPKPFELPILVARIQGLLRRTEWAKTAGNGAAAIEEPSSIFRFDGKSVNFKTLELHAQGKSVRLTLMEAELLR